MKVEATKEAGAVSERSRGAVRCGRPPRGLAGQVEERILDAAGQVFLEHGFQGASVDEIAEVACAGKPTIYARFPNKHALFAAVIERLVSRHTSLDPFSCPGGSIEQRLDALAAVILTRLLNPRIDWADPGRGRRGAAVSRSGDERQPHGAPTSDRSGRARVWGVGRV